ncbi:MAG: DegT/DnrJ/EryC1/StrS family aminotransferase, partial [Fusobacteriaceae bacterium]
MKKIPFNTLDRQFFMYQDEYEKKALDVLRSGWYILGPEVEEFEKEFSNYIGTKYCLGIDNGLNALVLAFRALGIKEGDEVLVQGNTFIASVMGITMNSATPVFVEPDKYDNLDVELLESKITDKTRAICVVHLYGQTANMEKIMKLAKKYNLYLVEDCAQSHGSLFNGKMSG